MQKLLTPSSPHHCWRLLWQIAIHHLRATFWRFPPSPNLFVCQYGVINLRPRIYHDLLDDLQSVKRNLGHSLLIQYPPAMPNLPISFQKPMMVAVSFGVAEWEAHKLGCSRWLEAGCHTGRLFEEWIVVPKWCLSEVSADLERSAIFGQT